MSATSGYYAPAGQGWRLCNSLVTLAHELTQVYGDTITCLGTVGDVAHAAENMGSDHNAFIRDPNEPSIGVVRAIDFGGPDAVLKSIRQRIWSLYAGSDPRVYRYGYGKGCSDNLINNWGLPFGTHVDTGDAGHLHISVTQVNGNSPSPSGYVAAIDSTAGWGFAGLDPSGGGTPITPSEEADLMTERIIALGDNVYRYSFGQYLKLVGNIHDAGTTALLNVAFSTPDCITKNTGLYGLPPAAAIAGLGIEVTDQTHFDYYASTVPAQPTVDAAAIAAAVAAALPPSSSGGVTAAQVQAACSAALAGTPVLVEVTSTIGAKP